MVERRIWALVFSVLAGVLTLLASFSIGVAYYPALAMPLIGLGLAGINAIWQRVRIGERP